MKVAAGGTTLGQSCFAIRTAGVWMSDDPLQHMRERIEMCRRLARNINDPDVARILREMADQGEIDLQKLLEARDGNAG